MKTAESPDRVLAIDVGTESVRAAVYSASGLQLGIGTSPNRTTHPHPGWAEQSPQEWAKALGEAVRAALASSSTSPASIRGIGIDGTTSTVVFLDRADAPLRDAILWMDVRAFEEAGIFAATGSPDLACAGGQAPSAEWFPCKVLWVKRHEPEIYRKSETIMELTDWLALLLTGERCLNTNTTSARWFRKPSADGGLPIDMYSKAGLGDLSSKIPASVLHPGEPAGRLTREAAALTGLAEGTPVAVGCGDAFAGTIGLDALDPGRIALITGSSHVITAHVDRPCFVRGLFGSYADAILPGTHLIEGGQASTGSVLRWFSRNFIGEEIATEARALGISTLALLDRKAALLPPGSENLLVLDHWQGSRCPWTDSTSRGVIRGLSLGHEPAHLHRAIMEGVAYGTALILTRMEKAGIPVDELRACGGPSRSPLWMSIQADVTGKPILLAENPDSVLLGSAMMASIAAGFHPSLREAAASMTRMTRRIEPDLARHEEYRFFVDQYERTYGLLAESAREMTFRAEATRLHR